MSINARRDKFRDEIRKKQRQAFFLQERAKNFNEQSTVLTNHHHLVQQLLQNRNIEQNLDTICNIVKSTHCQPEAMRLIQKGLTSVLVSFLKDLVYPSKTLQILSFLLQNFTQKPHSFDLYSQLYDFGIFQYLIKLLDLRHGGVLSTYILYCFSEARQDYCEAIFEGGIYNILMRELMQILQNCPYVQMDTQTEEYRFCIHILKTLENLAQLKESTLDFSTQKGEILKMVEFCLERRLFLKNVFGVFYEVICGEQPEIVSQRMVFLINQILAQTDPSSNFIQNMYATIFKLTPHRLLDYSLVFKNATQSSKIYKIVSYIFQQLIKKHLQSLIPTNEIFWQKIIVGCSNDEETFKRLLRVTSKIHIQNSLFSRIIAAALQSDCSLGVQREGLDILESFVKNEDRLDRKLNQINKHKIPPLLVKLSESRNSKIKERAAWILDYILGPMTEMAQRVQSL